jgi:GNAT superfamily N-acetyltransferase
MMNFEQYSQNYEDAVVNLWNHCCTFDPIDVWKFRRQVIFDDNFNPELAWIALDDHSQVRGFAYGTKRRFPYLERGLEPERGWINVMFVEKEYRRQGIGQDLLDRIEKQLTDLGAKNITLAAYSPNYFFWGIDPDHYPEAISFFEKNGYQALEEHFSMGKDLHGYVIPEETMRKKIEAEKKGYTFRLFKYSDSLELLQFLLTELGAGWKRNALISMREGTAPDYQIVVRDPAGKVCGWCMRAIDGNPMRFGPIGIAKAERNNGIGSILLDMQCYEMTKRGIYRMFFVTTEEKGRRYYERNGLTVIRRTIEYRKDMK